MVYKKRSYIKSFGKLKRGIQMKSIDSKVYWSQLCTYYPGSRIEEHTHEFFHYIYVVKGTGDISIDGKNYKFSLLTH